MRAFRIVLAALALVAFPLTSKAAPCAGFLDVDDASPFCLNVTWMKNRAITLAAQRRSTAPTPR